MAHNSSVYRLVNGEGDGLPGAAVERYADWVVLSISTEEAFGQRRALADALVELGARGVYVKRRIRADLRRSDPALLCPVNPECGEPAPAPLYVSEGQLKFAVELGGRVSTGLFPDQRESRQRILHSARGARVLNLFSYTGSFSVAAACGGAHSVTSVDASGRALRWARANFTLNGLLPEAFEFVRTDALRWLGRARPGSYDVIVLDPPSFSTSKSGSVFKAASDWSRLLEKTVLLLAPGGRLLTVTHHRSASFATLRRALSGACQRARRQAASFRDVPLPMDCPALGGEPTPTRAVWLNVK